MAGLGHPGFKKAVTNLWRVVITGRDPGEPNWVSTQGHEHGLIWFRRFHPAETPQRPTTTLAQL